MDLVQNRERVGARASLPAQVPSTLTMFALCAQAAKDGRAPRRARGCGNLLIEAKELELCPA